MKRNTNLLLIILGCVVMLVGAVSYGFYAYTNAQKEFAEDGYILGTVESDSQESVDNGYYFSAGDKYKKKYPAKIMFTDNTGDKVTTSQTNFVHFMSDNLSSFVKGVFIDMDDLDAQSLKYYNISAESVVEKQGSNYVVSTTDEDMRLQNFIWKISDEKYLIVSDTLKLHLSDGND